MFNNKTTFVFMIVRGVFLNNAAKYSLRILLGFLAFLLSIYSNAEEPYFWGQQQPPPQYPKFATGDSVCQSYNGIVAGGIVYAVWEPLFFSNGDPRTGQLAGGKCNLYRVSDNGGLGYIGVNFVRGDCEGGGVFNDLAGECEMPGQEQPRKSLGHPNKVIACNAPSLYKGDPIDIASGNSFQVESEFLWGSKGSGLGFYRYYNSLGGGWTHSYSAHLWETPEMVFLVDDDGGQSIFFKDAASLRPEATQFGTLSRSEHGWEYKSLTGDLLAFDSLGRLVSKRIAGGAVLSIVRIGFQTTVADDQGHSLTLLADAQGQLVSVTYDDLVVSYSYSALGQLQKVSRSYRGGADTRKYLYEVPGKPALLTGVVNESGVRYASWGYDSKGRADYNGIVGGVGGVKLVYNSDGSTLVEGELGKVSIYNFKILQGMKRVSSISGQPSENCLASNSSYIYNDLGQLVTKTDAKGGVTTYVYNGRGLETSRTEASSTSLARTTTTEWDPTRFLPVRIVEPDRTTVYSYDTQGRELSRQTTSH